MKDIDLDVNQFMKDFEENKSEALAANSEFSDAASMQSAMTTNSKYKDLI